MIVIIIIGIIIGICNIIGVLPGNIDFFFVKWFILRSFTEGLSIFFLHIGIGLRSLNNSIFIGISWTSMNTIVVLSVYFFSGLSNSIIASLVVLSTLLTYYLGICLTPSKYLHRRPANIRFSLLNSALILSQIAVLSLLLAETGGGGGVGTPPPEIVCAVEVLFAVCEFLQLVNILDSFSADSKFWQGI
jgi:hypothetical protein